MGKLQESCAIILAKSSQEVIAQQSPALSELCFGVSEFCLGVLELCFGVSVLHWDAAAW